MIQPSEAAYRIWWGNLSECVHLKALFAKQYNYIETHTNIHTHIYIYTCLQTRARVFVEVYEVPEEITGNP